MNYGIVIVSVAQTQSNSGTSDCGQVWMMYYRHQHDPLFLTRIMSRMSSYPKQCCLHSKTQKADKYYKNNALYDLSSGVLFHNESLLVNFGYEVTKISVLRLIWYPFSDEMGVY